MSKITLADLDKIFGEILMSRFEIIVATDDEIRLMLVDKSYKYVFKITKTK